MYEYVDDLTSDVMFKVTAKDLSELLSDSAKAMLEIMLENKCEADKEIRVEVNADDKKELLFKFLVKVLAEMDGEGIAFTEFNVLEASEKHAVVLCKGCDLTENMVTTLVKGVTYYKYDVKKTEEGYEATVVVDI